MEPTTPRYTGLVCIRCTNPVAVILDGASEETLAMHCPSCGNEWSADQPLVTIPVNIAVAD